MPFEHPDLRRVPAKSETRANPARILLYLVGAVCALWGLQIIFRSFFEITLLVFGGTGIWLASQHYDATVRRATIGWSIAAISLSLITIAIDPPSRLNVVGIVVVGMPLLMVFTIAWIAFCNQPLDRVERPATASNELNYSAEESSDIHDSSREWSWSLFARWSLSLCLITLLSSILAGVGFFYLIVVPIGYFFDVSLARLAFLLPCLVAPGVWGLGMIRFHRRYPSKRLIISLGVVGIMLYASMPVILYVVVLLSSGGWSIR